MAVNGLFEGVQTKGGRKVFLNVTIKGNGSSSPTTITGAGVTSVARTAAGRYTITLDEAYIRLDSCTFGFQDTNYATAAKRVNMGLIAADVVTAKTLTVIVEDGTDGNANAPIDLATTQYLHLALCLVNGSAALAMAAAKKGGLLASISLEPAKPRGGGMLSDDEAPASERGRDSNEDGEDMGQEAIDVAQEALDAISAGDAKAFDTALRAHYRACEEG